MRCTAAAREFQLHQRLLLWKLEDELEGIILPVDMNWRSKARCCRSLPKVAHLPLFAAASAHCTASSAPIVPQLQYHSTASSHPVSAAGPHDNISQSRAGWIAWSARRAGRHLRSTSSLVNPEGAIPASKMLAIYVCMGPCRIGLGRADEGLKSCSLAADMTLGEGCSHQQQACRSECSALSQLMALM